MSLLLLDVWSLSTFMRSRPPLLYEGDYFYLPERNSALFSGGELLFGDVDYSVQPFADFCRSQDSGIGAGSTVR